MVPAQMLSKAHSRGYWWKARVVVSGARHGKRCERRERRNLGLGSLALGEGGGTRGAGGGTLGEGGGTRGVAAERSVREAERAAWAAERVRHSSPPGEAKHLSGRHHQMAISVAAVGL